MSLVDPVRCTRVLWAVSAERARQEKLKDQGRFKHTCADLELTDAERYAILGEEFGEVARQVLGQPEGALVFDGRGSREGLREELVQVAAIAVAWVEAIDTEPSEVK